MKEARNYPTEIYNNLAGKHIALIGFDEQDTGRLLEGLAPFQVFTQSFTHRDANPDSLAFRLFDLLVVQLPQKALNFEWLPTDSASAITQPLLFIGPPDLLFQQISTRQIKHYDFLSFPWPPEEVILRIHNLFTATAVHANASANPIAPEKLRVLVVDDDPTIVATVRAVLMKHGMECMVAQNGGLAVTLVKAHHPDAVILDIHMPFLDGFDVLHAIKQNPKTADIVVILLTSLKFEADIVRGFKLGADDYIVKPFRPLELVARLNRLLQRPVTTSL